MKLLRRFSPSRSEHSVRVRGRAVYHSYSFDLGPGLDIFRVAHTLMVEDMGSVATSPKSNELRVSRSIVGIETALREAESMAKFMDEYYSDQPRLGVLFRQSPWLIIRFFFMYLAQVFSLAGTRSPSAEQVSKDNESELSDEPKRMVVEARDGLQKALVDFHVWGAIRTRTEQSQYSSRYFHTVPYLRVELNRVPYSDGLVGDEVLDVSLMLHRSGICILTLSTAVYTELDAKNIANCMVSEYRKLDRAEISEPIMRRFASGNGRITRALKKADLPTYERLRWVVMRPEADGPVSFDTVFEVYQTAIESVARRPSRSGWKSYTTLSIGAPTCGCHGSGAKDHHRSEFAQLMLRATRPLTLKPETEEDLLENHLKIEDQELWISAGNAMAVSWEQDQPDLADDLHHLIPIESAILQIRQLEQIDRITSDAVVRDKRLFGVQHLFAVGLQEYKRNLLQGPDAENVVEAVLNKNSAPDLYDRLMDRVKVLESIVATRYSRMVARRSIAISASGFIVVLLFLLPRISETITELEGQNQRSRNLIQAADTLLNGRGNLVLAVYVSAIVVAALVLVWMSIRKRIKPVRSRRFGFRLKQPIEVALKQPDESP
ncbi:hypothetical protein R1X32_01120 (plasmid) [Rhodococcus opacus]|uniref:hypothetical protein n=1 Tax=Rhodococcus opacus TaxID=37919 RepID=UPI0034D24BB4